MSDLSHRSAGNSRPRGRKASRERPRGRTLRHVGRDLLRLTRPQVIAQAVAYMWLGALIGGFSFADLPVALVPASLVVALIIALGFAINDYSDRALDAHAHPERLLPQGALHAYEALLVALGAALGAALLAISFLPVVAALVALANIGLTIAYSRWFKAVPLLGNMTIAGLNASLVVFGALAIGANSNLLWLVGAMLFCYSLGQELVYTAQDVAADGHFGITTIAVRYGLPLTLTLAYGAFVVAVGLGLLVWALHLASTIYLVGFMLFTALPIGVAVLPNLRSDPPEGLAFAAQVIRIIRVAALAPLLLLGLT